MQHTQGNNHNTKQIQTNTIHKNTIRQQKKQRQHNISKSHTHNSKQNNTQNTRQQNTRQTTQYNKHDTKQHKTGTNIT